MTFAEQLWEDGEDLRVSATPPIQANLAERRGAVYKMYRVHRKQRWGAAVVEFAIVAPLFFLLVFGMVEYGRMVMVQQVLTNASREGARSAVLDGASATAVKASVVEFLEESAINSVTQDNVEITPADPSTAGSGDSVTVTVTVDFDDVSWMPSPMYLGGRQLSTGHSSNLIISAVSI